MARVVIISGAGGGIGAAAARAFLRDGWTVYDFSRTNRAPEGVKHMSVDVTDDARAREAADAVVSAEGRLDALVNNAGCGISGAIEFTSSADSARLMSVNLMGADNLTRAALKHMRAARGGAIIFTSSLAALLPIPFQAWYSASKAALNAYALALRNETRPFGIRVACVMPGDTKTGFTAARQKARAGDDIYKGRIQKAVSTMEKDEQNGMPPEKTGALIAKIARKRNPRPLYVPGAKYKLFAFLTRVMPAAFVNWVVGKLY